MRARMPFVAARLLVAVIAVPLPSEAIEATRLLPNLVESFRAAAGFSGQGREPSRNRTRPAHQVHPGRRGAQARMPQLRRGSRLHVDRTSNETAYRQCHHMPTSEFGLTPSLVREHSHSGTVIVTFTNRMAHAFALNWARQLHTTGLRSLIGISERLDRAAEDAMADAGAGLFCADGRLIRLNGQAGRWDEVAPLLQAGLDVLISDSDIAWIRDPIPYFRAVHVAHPTADFLLCSDKVGNAYSSNPLPSGPVARIAAGAPAASRRGAPRGRGLSAVGGSDDLDLEIAMGTAVASFNIGIIYLYTHAHARHAEARRRHPPPPSAPLPARRAERAPSAWQMFRAWVESVQTGKHGERLPHLAPWDQEPINKVIRAGMRKATDPMLAEVFGRKLTMGVLPMLQFATSFTYFMHRRRRESLGARAYSLHAIFSHGKDALRKQTIFREEMLWHDPPSYYEEGNFLRYENVVAQSVMREGGFQVLESQLADVRAAFGLALALNRTLILPRVHCSDRTMAFPCYAWYHRARFNFGWGLDKVPLPHSCPLYYWLNERAVEELALPTREPSFLHNPRTPPAITGDVGVVRFESAPVAVRRARAAPASRQLAAADADEVRHPGATTLPALVDALAPIAHKRVLHVHGLSALTLAGARLRLPAWPRRGFRPTARTPTPLHMVTGTVWCAACALTRKVTRLDQVNRSVGRELEQFCRTEARGSFGLPGGHTTCCHKDARPRLCSACRAGEAKKPLNASELPRTAQGWLPLWARLSSPRDFASQGSAWRCRHPTCTGSDPVNFP